MFWKWSDDADAVVDSTGAFEIPAMRTGLPPTSTEAKPTVIRCFAPLAAHVYLAGTFNDWNPTTHHMERHVLGGPWELTLFLPPGRHEYKFIVDGEWCCDPGCNNACDTCQCGVRNAFGTMNHFIDVG